VALDFQDRAYAKGKLVTFVALAIALLAMATGIFSERSRRVA
jgi:hypothetical protein